MSLSSGAIFRHHKGNLYEFLLAGEVETIRGWRASVTYRSQASGKIYTREKVVFLNNFNFIGMLNE